MRIPQSAETLAVLGGRPWWLWGFEQGVNEAGVAIGNEAIYTRDPVPDDGLLGMDLVRLGLERGSTASEAKDVITSLLEEYGQGGVAVRGTDRRYHNSYIIADPHEAWVLETSARHWVAKRIQSAWAISNLITITDDWDQASSGIAMYARDRGWFSGTPEQKLDFRRTFEDAEVRALTEPRYLASCRFTESSSITVQSMKRHLRDHFEGGTINVASPDRARTICLHPGDYASSTAASFVVELRPGSSRTRPLAWWSMATPCTGVFLPVELGTPLPEPLTTGTETRMEASLWWVMRRLERAVDKNPVELTPIVQQHWFEMEDRLDEAIDADSNFAHDELATLVSQVIHEGESLIASLMDDGHRSIGGGSMTPTAVESRPGEQPRI
jgi:secernin